MTGPCFMLDLRNNVAAYVQLNKVTFTSKINFNDRTYIWVGLRLNMSRLISSEHQ